MDAAIERKIRFIGRKTVERRLLFTVFGFDRVLRTMTLYYQREPRKIGAEPRLYLKTAAVFPIPEQMLEHGAEIPRGGAGIPAPAPSAVNAVGCINVA